MLSTSGQSGGADASDDVTSGDSPRRISVLVSLSMRESTSKDVLLSSGEGPIVRVVSLVVERYSMQDSRRLSARDCGTNIGTVCASVAAWITVL